jgi:23S rRNA (uracil1939-C5)-methyltransferase
MQPRSGPAGGPQLWEGLVSGLAHDGRGVIRLNDGVAFVEAVLPDERVRVRLQQRSRRRLEAELQERLSAADVRCRPACILADVCGGCSLQHLQIAAQRSWKREKLMETLQRLGGLTDLSGRVPPTLHGGEGLGYRNRAILPLERTEAGRLRAGYYRKGSHRIVNLNHCPVLDPRLDGLIAPLKQELEASGWPVDRHLSGGGGLRHLALRIGHHSGEILITLVSSGLALPGLSERAEQWLRRWPEVVGVGLNVQDRPSNVLMGADTVSVAGRPVLEERFAGLTYSIGPDCFFQVNTPMAERVVPLLLQALPELPGGRLVDAYCGIGTYSLPLAAAGWQVHGLELAASTLALAEVNARRNRLEGRTRFSAGAVRDLLAEAIHGADALLLDPPRKGLEAGVLTVILAAPPATLLYLSCDPATLARDLASLCGEGGPYRLEQAQPLDFFPQTSHLETLVTLRRV